MSIIDDDAYVDPLNIKDNMKRFVKYYYDLKKDGIKLYKDLMKSKRAQHSKSCKSLTELASLEPGYKQVSDHWSEKTYRNPNKLDYYEGRDDERIDCYIHFLLGHIRLVKVSEDMYNFALDYKYLQNASKDFHRALTKSPKCCMLAHYGFKSGEDDITKINIGQLVWFSSNEAKHIYSDPITHKSNLTCAMMKNIQNLKAVNRCTKLEFNDLVNSL